MLLQFFFSRQANPSSYYEIIYESLSKEKSAHETFTSHELITFLEQNQLIGSTGTKHHHELLCGELTHAAMVIEDTENDVPNDYGNVVHEEVEGQETACQRTFDAMAKTLHGSPCIGDTVVIKEGGFKQNLGIVKSINEDGSFCLHFEEAIYSGGLTQEMLASPNVHLQTTEHGMLSGSTALIDGSRYLIIKQAILNMNSIFLHV